MQIRSFNIIPGLALLLSLGGCGGSSAGPDPVAQQPPAVGAPASRTVSGSVSKGPIAGATIQIFELDADGSEAALPVGTAVSDDAGNWQLELPVGDGYFLVRSAGGHYIDESDPQAARSVQFAVDEHLEAILPPAVGQVTLTVLSQALFNKTRAETASGQFASVFETNRQFFASAFGFDVATTIPTAPLAPAATATAAERSYALLLGGIANAVNSAAIELGAAVPDYPLVRALARDLGDCRLDGMFGTRPVQVDSPTGPIALPSGASLDAETLRFRNNNFDVWTDTPLPSVDPTPCAELAGELDVTLPIITGAPADTIVAAQSAAGTPSSIVVVQDLLAGLGAVDDRPGGVVLAVDIPDQLVLGANLITATAEDASGNVATVSFTLTVVDLMPPSIVAPAAFELVATAPLTPVTPGVATVSDNVTTAAALVVSNNAADALAVGSHVITWQVTDAAGLTATATQTITILPAAPQALTPGAGLTLVEGQPTDIDLAARFDDPDGSPFTVTLAGLPPGSGLAMTSAGRLVGAPNDADVLTTPLQLSLVADDGGRQTTDQFAVTVAAVNDPPTFSIPPTSALDEDFTTAAIITPIPGPVGASETGQVVSYSLEFLGGVASLVDTELDTASGTVTLRSVADANGTALYRLQADDGQPENNLFAVEFEVVVTAINDAPRLQGNVSNVSSDVLVPLSLELGSLVVDPDDALLDFQVNGLPPGFAADADGRIDGAAVAGSELVQLFPVAVSVTDPSGALLTFEFDWQVAAPDSDADGVADYIELANGSDPLDSDSDDDGLGDGHELAIGADPNLPATAVFYVSPFGNDAADGLTPATAKQTHAGLGVLAAGDSAASPTAVIYLANHDEPEHAVGLLALQAPCDNIALLAENLPENLFAGGRVTSFLRGARMRLLDSSGCGNLRVAGLGITGSTNGAVVLRESAAEFWRVWLGRNDFRGNGAGIQARNGSLTLLESALAANRSTGEGGALNITGATASLSVRDSLISGNEAARGAGAHIDTTGGTIEIFNSLLTANRSKEGGALRLVDVPNASVSQSTFLWNASFDPSGGQAVNVVGAPAPYFADNIFWFNRSAGGIAGSFGTVPGTVQSDFNLLEQAAIGPADIDITVTGPAFAAAYYLDPTGSPALDSGSGPAALTGLDFAFSVAGSRVAPDTGVADRGFHYPLRYAPPGPAVVASYFAPNSNDPRTGPVLLDIRWDGRPIGAGHSVIATLPPNAPLVVIGIRGVDPLGDGRSAIARDLGDGRYLLSATNRDELAAAPLVLFVDGQPVSWPPMGSQLRQRLPYSLTSIPAQITTAGEPISR